MTHGLAWLQVHVFATRELLTWFERVRSANSFREANELFVRVACGELLDQVLSGIPMSQSEFARLRDFGLVREETTARQDADIFTIVACGNTPEHRHRLAQFIVDSDGEPFDAVEIDEAERQIRSHLRSYVKHRIAPRAHEWHLADSLIPMDIIAELGSLGVFGVSIPEIHGGMGSGKVAMCVATEELSRGFLGIGSLGTRSEIAAELILHAGTSAQKERYLPAIASGRLLTTAVFTEPESGSDLASISTSARRHGDSYRITGSKTWITHAARADLMILLARTNREIHGYGGLSLFLIEKPRGDDIQPFPARGMTGSEIGVLGYRGMKEYELTFDGFETPLDSLLGDREGAGFKQLMHTFESARIQTAARAVGVTQAALDTALKYARERIQFGKSIIEFPRVADKIVHMAIDAQLGRLLTQGAAHRKDSLHRCDLEAGAAKLFAARAAWSAADNAVQIHGGNGYSLAFEVSRLLCDARILNIFEGAAEIQAQIIARRLLSG